MNILHRRPHHPPRRVGIKRVRWYGLSSEEVALLFVLLGQWRRAGGPLEGKLLKVTDSLEAKLRAADH